MSDDLERDDEEATPNEPASSPEPSPSAASPTPDATDAPDEEDHEPDTDAEDPADDPADEASDEEDEDDDDGQDEAPPRSQYWSEPPPRESKGFRDSDLFRQQRKRLELTLREIIRKAVEKGVDAGVGAIEQSVDVIERSMEVGRGRVKSVREVIEEVKLPKDLPKDLASALFSQIEEGKNVLVGAIASEVRGFLEETDIAYELQRVLTSLSFEISTEIRFVPNERGLPRAEVRSKARPKVSARRAKRRRHDDDQED